MDNANSEALMLRGAAMEIEDLSKWPSNSPLRPPLMQVKGSFEAIQKHVTQTGKFIVFPNVKNNERELLTKRLQEISDTGCLIVTKSLTSLMNLKGVHDNSDKLFEAIYAIPGRPSAVLCVADSTKTEEDKTKLETYTKNLTRNVISAIRRFTNVHFGAVCCVIDRQLLQDSHSFQERMQTTERRMSKLCNPDSLAMGNKKYREVVKAMIASVAVTDKIPIPGAAQDDKLWFMTKHQFYQHIQMVEDEEVNFDLEDRHLEISSGVGQGNSTRTLLWKTKKSNSDVDNGTTVLLKEETKKIPHDSKSGFEKAEKLTELLTISEKTQLPKYQANSSTDCSTEVDLKKSEGGNVKIVNFLDRNMKPVDSSGILPSDLLQLKVKVTQKVFVKTRGYRRVREILQQFGHVTITGGVGEGKTSMALMLGVEYRNEGYQLLMVDDVDSFNIRFLLQSKVPSFVIFDDIFGSVGLKTEIGQLKRMLEYLFLLMKKDKSVIAESESKVGGNIICPGLVVVFTTKSYNLNDGLQHIKGGKFDFFTADAVLDLSKEQSANYTTDERMTIFESHKIIHKSNATVSLSDFSRGHFGFPLICKLFFELGESTTNTTDFFTSPLSFLRKELEKLLSEASSRSAALILMLLCEDKLHLAKLELKSEDEEFDSKLDSISIFVSHSRTQITSAVRNLRGTFFTEGDIIGFSHPVMYDACAVALATQNIALVLKHCTLKFLYERVRECSGESSQVSDNHIICISSSYHDLVCERLLQGIENGQYSLALTHPLLKVKTIGDRVVEELFLKLKPIHETEETKPYKHDLSQIIFWVVSGKNRSLFETILKHRKIIFENEIHAAIKASASCGNTFVLELLFADDSVHIGEDMLCEAFLIAAENHHSEIVSSILQFSAKRDRLKRFPSILSSLLEGEIPLDIFLYGSLSKMFGLDGISSLLLLVVLLGQEESFIWLLRLNELIKEDITSLSLGGVNLLHLACQGGSTLIVKRLLRSFYIDCRGKHGLTPVMIAAVSGQKDVFCLLVNEGADLKLTDDSGDTLLHLSCEGGNPSIVENLLHLFDINCRNRLYLTPVMTAAVSGKKEVFNLLVKRGADMFQTNDKGDNLLHFASQGGNAAIVQYLLKYFDANSRGRSGSTPLMHAAVGGHKEVFYLLLKAGAGLEILANDGNTPLHFACQGGNTEIVNQLLQSFDVNSKGNNNFTPVMAAAIHGKEKVFHLLVNNSADLFVKDNDGDSLLHLACFGGNESIVECLLPHFDINIQGQFDSTPVMVSAVRGHKEVFDLLMKREADITLTNMKGNTVLHHACQGGNSSIVERLLPLNDINAKNKSGSTPLMYAAVGGHKEVFYLLLKAGAGLEILATDGNTPLHFACQGGNTEIVNQLLQSFDVNSKGNNNFTPVMAAAIHGKEKVFHLLVNNSANLFVKDNDGDSLLHLACFGGNESIVECLLPHFDINIRGQLDSTPVMVSAVRGHKGVFDLLMKREADITLTNMKGRTVLHHACQGGNPSIVERLLPLNDINAKDKSGLTPIMVAAICEEESVLNLLVEMGADLTLSDNSGETALHLACRYGKSKRIIEGLLRYVEINARGSNGHTPIMRAVCGGHIEVFDFLLNSNANLNILDSDGDSILHLACEKDNIDVVKHVLPHCNINLRDKLGWTPLMLALVNGRSKISLYLVSQGADVKLVDKIGDDILTLAHQGGCTEFIKQLFGAAKLRNVEKWSLLMKTLVYGHWTLLQDYEKGSLELIQRDGFGDTLLHLACRGGDVQCVEHLLPCYDINVQGRYDWTPLMVAARCGHLDVARCLLSHQPNLTLVSESGVDVLSLACCSGNVFVIRELLLLSEFETKILTVSLNGNSLLHLACMGGHMKLVEDILPCHIDKQGQYGLTPVMIAAYCGQYSVFQYLLSQHADLSLLSDAGEDVLYFARLGKNKKIVDDLLTLPSFQDRKQLDRT